MKQPADPKVLIDRVKLLTRVKQLANQISHDYHDKPLVLVGILKGAVIFLADLLREIKAPVEIDFIQMASYGAGRQSSSQPQIKMDCSLNLKGKHVLVVEDIIDSGFTAHFLTNHLAKKKPKSLGWCVLLDKPLRRKAAVSIDYRGFEIADKFVVGYGLDFDEQFRNLPYLAYLEWRWTRCVSA